MYPPKNIKRENLLVCKFCGKSISKQHPKTLCWYCQMNERFIREAVKFCENCELLKGCWNDHVMKCERIKKIFNDVKARGY